MKWLVFAGSVLLPVVVLASCSDSNRTSPLTDAGHDATDSGSSIDSPVGHDGGGDAFADVHPDGDAAPPLTGKYLWAKRFGNDPNGTSYEPRVTFDKSGNLLAVGCFDKTMDFGGGVLTSAGDKDIFVAKFDPNGNHLWSKRFGDAAAQCAGGVVTDGAGNIFIVGGMVGSTDFGGGALTSAGGSDVFVAKFDAAGNHVWSKNFGDAQGQGAAGVALVGGADIVVFGNIVGTIDFGGGPLSGSGSPYGMFLARLSSAGGYGWAKTFTQTGAIYMTEYQLDTDPTGNVVIGGEFTSTLDFGGGTLTNAGGTDVFLAKFDSSGSHLWSKRYGDATDQHATGIALRSTGDIFVTGYFGGNLDFGSGPVTANPGVYLARLDASGSGLWSKAFGFRTGGSGPIAVDAYGDPVIGGQYYGTIDFGGGALPDGTNAPFVVKFDASGKFAWQKTWAAGGPAALAYDADGYLGLAGGFLGNVDFGGGTLTSVQTWQYGDTFLAKFGP